MIRPPRTSPDASTSDLRQLRTQQAPTSQAAAAGTRTIGLIQIPAPSTSPSTIDQPNNRPAELESVAIRWTCRPRSQSQASDGTISHMSRWQWHHSEIEK